MSRKDLPERDLQLLTAYLDGELPPEQAARVARRLATDPVWKETLAAMQAVKQGMAALPRQRAPRSFTLPASEVTPRRAHSLTVAYRWASAAALLLLLFAFAGDFLSRNMGLEAASAPPPNALSMAAAPTEQPALKSAPATQPNRGGAPTSAPKPLAVAPQHDEGTAEAEATAVTPTPPPPPIVTPLPAAPSPSPPQPAAPPPRGWHVVEGVLAFLAVLLGFLGWRHR